MLRLKPNHSRVVRCKCTTDTRIYAPYFQKYSEAVCGSVPLRAQEACIWGMEIPDFQEQQEIIKGLEAVKQTVDLGSAEGAAMILIKDHDIATLEALVDAIHAYHEALMQIRAIVSDTIGI